MDIPSLPDATSAPLDAQFVFSDNAWSHYRIDQSDLIAASLTYKGTYDASTNPPVPPSVWLNNGDFYVVANVSSTPPYNQVGGVDVFPWTILIRNASTNSWDYSVVPTTPFASQTESNLWVVTNKAISPETNNPNNRAEVLPSDLQTSYIEYWNSVGWEINKMALNDLKSNIVENTLFVSKSWDDTLWLRWRFDRQFLTPQVACNNAQDGDTIIIYPWVYDNASLFVLWGLSNVNVYCYDGVIFRNDSATAIFNDTSPSRLTIRWWLDIYYTNAQTNWILCWKIWAEIDMEIKGINAALCDRAIYMFDNCIVRSKVERNVIWWKRSIFMDSDNCTLETKWGLYQSVDWWPAIVTTWLSHKLDLRDSAFDESTNMNKCIQIEDVTSDVTIRNCIVSSSSESIECTNWPLTIKIFWDVTMTVPSTSCIFTKPVTIDPTV